MAIPRWYWRSFAGVRDPRRMISRLSTHDIAAMHRAGQAAAATLREVGQRLRPGLTTAIIDLWVRELTAAQGGIPSQLGYHGFPAAVCTSRNQVVCHGVPGPEVLVEGDILNVDVTTELDGFHGDTSETFYIGTPSEETRHVVEVARRARDLGVSLVAPGVRVGDIGQAIEDFARDNGCSSVHDFGGHGIGRKMHLPPHIPFVGPAGRGPRLRVGMAITIEPMINLGRPDLVTLADGWTVVSADGLWSAQFEHTVIVTDHGAEVTTL